MSVGRGRRHGSLHAGHQRVDGIGGQTRQGEARALGVDLHQRVESGVGGAAPSRHKAGPQQAAAAGKVQHGVAVHPNLFASQLDAAAQFAADRGGACAVQHDILPGVLIGHAVDGAAVGHDQPPATDGRDAAWQQIDAGGGAGGIRDPHFQQSERRAHHAALVDDVGG
ncbi:hypothetical protein D3C87_1461520 [compost metagenome]